jgi:putative nucleotidyltransferase with HDIG domain
MLISILLDLRLGVIVNLLLALAISFITKGDQGFLYTAIIGGTFAAFIVSGANQRSRLSASGLVIAIMNAVIISCIGLINKSSASTMVNNAALVAVNGMLSTIFTIGILPFFEITFNIITPLKLLELSNPNQPLLKRLLMEAPGTYHHSLMVGNLAEAAAEAINGNALLARVGAYYHDVGKLKRPNFFKENQLSENPHDRMTPNLSTLVITSHTSDGVEIAEKYKVPPAVREMISQHHGTTLVAYFYYKAKKGDKADSIKQDDFRYQGPRPSSKEAAVVMLADSVEAAVRSMADKTEGKMEGLIRKIIKDKLDDGQLDHCDLTLKDLDTVAKAFIRVFGGYFHEREEYPEMKIKRLQGENENDYVNENGVAADMNTGETIQHSDRYYETGREEMEELKDSQYSMSLAVG